MVTPLPLRRQYGMQAYAQARTHLLLQGSIPLTRVCFKQLDVDEVLFS